MYNVIILFCWLDCKLHPTIQSLVWHNSMNEQFKPLPPFSWPGFLILLLSPMGIKSPYKNPTESVGLLIYREVLALLFKLKWVMREQLCLYVSYIDIYATVMIWKEDMKMNWQHKAPTFFFPSVDLLCVCANIILRNWIEWGYKYNVISAPQDDILWHWYWHYAELISFNPKHVALHIYPSLILMH